MTDHQRRTKRGEGHRARLSPPLIWAHGPSIYCRRAAIGGCRTLADQLFLRPGRSGHPWELPPDMTDTTLSKPSPLERALAVVTEVRAGEGVAALLLALNVCLILTASLILKPVREELILSMGPSGAEYKSYVGAAIAASLVFAVPAYARLRGPSSEVTAGGERHAVLRVASGAVLSGELGAGAVVQARHPVLPLARHLQHDDRGAVLGARERSVFRERGQAVVPAGRHWPDRRRVPRQPRGCVAAPRLRTLHADAGERGPAGGVGRARLRRLPSPRGKPFPSAPWPTKPAADRSGRSSSS